MNNRTGILLNVMQFLSCWIINAEAINSVFLKQGGSWTAELLTSYSKNTVLWC
jgi:hypothetical protein